MSMVKRFMAKRCDICPLCKYARANPETFIGRLMHWHGKFCPFWKAWKEIYGEDKESGQKTAAT
jgi:hypothetical protein